MNHEHQQVFASMMAGHGITEMHGLDLMRQIKMLSHLYGMLISSHMRDAQLSGSRWRLLLHLHMAEQMEQASLSPTELSRMQHVTKNTISSLLRSLEEQGLIERTLDPKDRRQFKIRLTDEGRELIRKSTPEHVVYLNQLARDLTPDEVTQLGELLHKLRVSLTRHGDLPDTYCQEKSNP
ncbi:MAG TPA: MarR family transcriptional regulator [Caldilineae bacterium]|nr:MarR family transcriptional regulator [Caldilineae bacterium]